MRVMRTMLAMTLLAASLPVMAQGWSVTKSLKVGGEGGWDYLTVDAASKRLFIPRGTHTMIVDEVSGKTLGDIPGQKTAHGVAIVPEVGRGFITDGGGSGAIVVFDLKTYAVLGTLTAVPDADGIIYDEGTKTVLVSAGDSNSLLAFSPTIDPKVGKIGPGIPLGGAPEFLAADGEGKVFVNLQDKDVVAVVDLKAKKVLAKWPVAPGAKPVGLSIDKKGHKLFIGCRKPQMLIVMSTVDGKIVASLPIGAGVDATAFDNGHVFASCGDGTLAIAGERDGKFVIEQTVKTRTGSRTMGVDTATHAVLLSAAEYEEAVAGSTARRKMKPGTFEVIEVTK